MWRASSTLLPTRYGLADATLSAITACTVYEAEARNKLCANIVLSGGTTMCRGFAERLHEELAGLAPSAPIKVVHAAADGICASWAGGASFAAHPSFKDSKWIHRWIARKEYGAEARARRGGRCSDFRG